MKMRTCLDALDQVGASYDRDGAYRRHGKILICFKGMGQRWLDSAQAWEIINQIENEVK